MKNKLNLIISLGLILTLISVCFTVNAPAEEMKETGIFDSLKAESKITFEYNESIVKDPLMPASSSLSIPVSINYSIDGTFADFYANYLLKNKKAKIELSISSPEQWCIATLDQKTAELEITTQGKEIQLEPIKVTLAEDAPAFKKCDITLKAKVGEIKGPLGISTLVLVSDNFTVDIPITPGYLPLIDVKIDNNFWEVPPLNITEIGR